MIMGEEETDQTQSSRRTLRDRAARAGTIWYADPDFDAEEEATIRGYRLEEKIKEPCFPPPLMILRGNDLNLAMVQKHGIPILIREKTGLGLRVPRRDFTVKHVKLLVGPHRLLDVMDVATQKNTVMTMEEWCRYYFETKRPRLLNVISLEFSHTGLEHHVEGPLFVRQIDWVDSCWPQQLKKLQTDSTNAIDSMMYPKVRKYCLMSVTGCFTDFHIDFGGSSVWYHILKGLKIFWLIPPTEGNLALYQNWVLSGKQTDVFFGDTVENCGRLHLFAGNTFFIPSGWIHAVYTAEDSLVPKKFRYPFFNEMLWYVIAKYVYMILGKNHLDLPDIIEVIPALNDVHLTSQEFYGLKAIVRYLHELHISQKNVPDIIKEPAALINDVRTVVSMHSNDQSHFAVTGRSILTGVSDSDMRPRRLKRPIALTMNPYYYTSIAHDPLAAPTFSEASGSNIGSIGGSNQRCRRIRCMTCDPCRRTDCGQCSCCYEMMNPTGSIHTEIMCQDRQCTQLHHPNLEEVLIDQKWKNMREWRRRAFLTWASGVDDDDQRYIFQPMLPINSSCVVCNLNGWGEVLPFSSPEVQRELPSSLMECNVCFEISHPECMAAIYPGAEGVFSTTTLNCWECPKCNMRSRGNFEFQIDNDIVNGDFFNPLPAPAMDMDIINSLAVDMRPTDMDHDAFLGSRDGSFGGSDIFQFQNLDDNGDSSFLPPPDLPSEPERPIAMKEPLLAVRPAPTAHVPCPENPLMDKETLLSIFRLLSPQDLSACELVCKVWSQHAINPRLWQRIEYCNKTMDNSHLPGIVRRQPEVLFLDWTLISDEQLRWLIERLPQLRRLSLQGMPVKIAATLCTCVCPPLHSLDLSYVQGLNDYSLRGIFAPPSDSRPGLSDTDSRLRNLRCLKLAGCDISDLAIRSLAYLVPQLVVLDISSCARITDAGIVQLVAPNAPTATLMTSLNMSNLRRITNLSLEHVKRFYSLMHLDISNTPLITKDAVFKYLQARGERVEVVTEYFSLIET